jgi:hypothetical protein
VLGAAALAGPAAAVQSDAQSTSTPSQVGQSQDLRTPDAKDAAKANVYVPPAELGPTGATAQPPTWPSNPEPIGQHDEAVNTSSSGLDWDSAALGAAAAALFAIALAGVIGVRRRRTAGPGSIVTP